MPLRDRVAMESEDSEDRISQLPDPILHHILSKVPDFRHKDTTHLVRTCILLSKRWSNLWASFPHLYFDELNHRRCFSHSIRLNLRYARLVNAVLFLRDTSDVQSLFLRRKNDSDEYEPHRLVTWMQYAINHHVKDLTVHVVLNERYFELPSGIFTCWSLEKLHLNITGHGESGLGYIEIPEFVRLGRLRKLSLRRFGGNSISLNALISGCPALEDMYLSDCMLRDPDICSNSLKKLYVLYCEIAGRKFRISVPGLQDLFLACNNIDRAEVLLENLSSLAKATLQTDDYAGEFGKLLKYTGPSNRCITGSKLLELQTLQSLKKLVLYGDIIIDNLPIVAHFLHRSPNLELVILQEKVVISLDPVLKKRQLKMDFDCPHLKDILATFDEKTNEISELLNHFCDDKCSCFEE